MIKIFSVTLFVCLFAASCSGDGNVKPTPQANDLSQPAASDASQIDAAKGNVVKGGDSKAKLVSSKREVKLRDAKCGCSIEGIGKCGNYIMFDGEYVPLLNATLGKMEFCKQKDAGCKIKVAGAMKDGNYIAEQWKFASR